MQESLLCSTSKGKRRLVPVKCVVCRNSSFRVRITLSDMLSVCEIHRACYHRDGWTHRIHCEHLVVDDYSTE